MIIDAHAHVFLRPTMTASGHTPMSAEDQVAVMDAKGIDRAIILPLNNPEAPVECQGIGEVLTICDRYPGRFIPFCNLDPRISLRPERVTAADYLPRLERYRALGCRGMGEILARLYFDDPRMLALLEACRTVGFPVTFHTTSLESDAYGVLDEPGIPRLEAVLRALPGLRVFGHSPGFWNEISGHITPEEQLGYPTGPVAPGGRVPALFRAYPDLYGDLSANSGLNALRRDPEHAWRFLEEFQDRLLLGLDVVSREADMPHLEWLRAARDRGDISTAVFDKVTGLNVLRILGGVS